MSELAYDFEWDARKAATNLQKHGVTFEQAASVFSDQLSLTVFDEEHSDHEERWFTLGFSIEGKLLAVAHTHDVVSLNGSRVRIISARLATIHEQRFYADKPR